MWLFPKIEHCDSNSFIGNLTSFRIAMETDLLVCQQQCFQEVLNEERWPNLSVSSSSNGLELRNFDQREVETGRSTHSCCCLLVGAMSPAASLSPCCHTSSTMVEYILPLWGKINLSSLQLLLSGYFFNHSNVNLESCFHPWLQVNFNMVPCLI